MRKTICTCDRCGKEITGTTYTLTCYAEGIDPTATRATSARITEQNLRQNMILMAGSKELCQECKDELTDGLFIV